MELDDLKESLRSLEARLDKESRLNLDTRIERKRSRVRASLWPFYLMNGVQVLVGLMLALAVGPLWVGSFDQLHLFIAGLIVHVYAVAMMALGGPMLALLFKLDFSAPVVSIQRQLAHLQRAYIRNGLILGLPWCLLWIPFGMLLFQNFGFDVFASFSRTWFFANVAVGTVVGLVALWMCRGLWFRPTNEADARKLEETWGGRRLLEARRLLDELAEFTDE